MRKENKSIKSPDENRAVQPDEAELAARKERAKIQQAAGGGFGTVNRDEDEGE